MEYIWGWLSNQVYKQWDKVIKLPRKWEYSDSIKKGYEIHKKYLWDSIPNTEFNEIKWKSTIMQDFVQWNPVDLAQTSNERVFEIIELWYKMQKEEKIYFDLFWLEWILSLYYNYLPPWLSNNIMKKDSDLLFKLNSYLLEKLYNYPRKELRKIIEKSWNPFLVHNLLETPNWEIKMIDFEYKRLSPFNITNQVFSLITKKTVSDVLLNKNL